MRLIRGFGLEKSYSTKPGQEGILTRLELESSAFQEADQERIQREKRNKRKKKQKKQKKKLESENRTQKLQFFFFFLAKGWGTPVILRLTTVGVNPLTIPICLALCVNSDWNLVY